MNYRFKYPNLNHWNSAIGVLGGKPESPVTLRNCVNNWTVVAVYHGQVICTASGAPLCFRHGHFERVELSHEI